MKRLTTIPCSAALCCILPGLVFGQPDKEDKKPAGDQRSLFDRIDQNKDGQIVADEIPAERKSYFQRLLREQDKNGDGRLSKDEFQQSAEKERRPPAANENGQRRRPEQGGFDAAAIFPHLDKNADGKLTPDEMPEERRERFRAGLARSDKDGDGGLNLDEFRNSMAAMAGRRAEAGQPAPGSAPPRPNIAGAPFFRAIDVDRDGKLSGEELAKAGEALKTLDKNGDGTLTPDELVPTGPPASNAPGNSPLGQPGRRPDGGRPQAGRPQAAAFLERLKQADSNGDGKLSKDEAPERLKENFDRIDANSDGQLDQQELQRMVSRIRPNQSDNPPNRPGNRKRDGDK
jgi:Ca2+-binding EF-hand superfamily protein